MLVLSADGYVPAQLSVVPAGDLTRTVTLKPRAGGPAVPPQRRQASGRQRRQASGRQRWRSRRAAAGNRRAGGGRQRKPGAGSDEPTNDIETFPQEAPAQPRRRRRRARRSSAARKHGEHDAADDVEDDTRTTGSRRVKTSRIVIATLALCPGAAGGGR